MPTGPSAAGAEGTWRDAEDGWLEGNPIAQGSVDSCISFQIGALAPRRAYARLLDRGGQGSRRGKKTPSACAQDRRSQLLESTRGYWQSWLAKKEWDFKDLTPQAAELFKRSLLVIRTQTDRGGAIIAANDSDILHFNRDHYSYMWPPTERW